jgi:hypothetical protein
MKAKESKKNKIEQQSEQKDEQWTKDINDNTE